MANWNALYYFGSNWVACDFMRKKMFYGASHLIFQKAKYLRNHVTATEMIFWGKLKECFPCYHFRRQHPLADYIADFYSHKLKLVIELDGSIHDLEKNRKRDEERQAAIESLGLTVIRFTNQEIKQGIESCIEIIKNYINPRDS
jgi:cyclase